MLIFLKSFFFFLNQTAEPPPPSVGNKLLYLYKSLVCVKVTVTVAFS